MNSNLMLPTKHIQTLQGHRGNINSVNFSADGEFALSGGNDSFIKLWNPYKGTEIKTYKGHNDSINDIRASDDNSKLLSAADDKLAIIWDVATGRYIRKLFGHNKGVNCIRANSEMTIALTGSKDSTLQIWDLRTHTKDPIEILSDFKESITSLEFQNLEILAGSVDGNFRIYDIRMGLRTTFCVGYPVTSVGFSKDSNCILASSLDENIRLFDKSTGEVLNTFSGHRNSSYKLNSELTSNDEFVVSGSEDGIIYYWDLINATVAHTLLAGSTVIFSLACHQKSPHLLCSCGEVAKLFAGKDD